MRYSMCFFPLIGVVIAMLSFGADYLLGLVESGNVFRAMVLTVIPYLVTGGIHLDGYLDTTDARRSWQGKEDRLRILKDPHVGAFAVIFGALLLLVQFGCFSELRHEQIGIVCVGYVLSRCLSGLSVLLFPKAKKDGMLKLTSDSAQKAKGRVVVILCAQACLCVLCLALWVKMAFLPVLLVCLLIFCYYRRMSEKEFGGTTGDLAGWFLCICETGVVISAVVIGWLDILAR